MRAADGWLPKKMALFTGVMWAGGAQETPEPPWRCPNRGRGRSVAHEGLLLGSKSIIFIPISQI